MSTSDEEYITADEAFRQTMHDLNDFRPLGEPSAVPTSRATDVACPECPMVGPPQGLSSHRLDHAIDRLGIVRSWAVVSETFADHAREVLHGLIEEAAGIADVVA